ncbi:MAG: 3-deoxy-7-phosphoheptulonate synthase, partial [Clostridiales bacterium]|nr:3-deoxy-7-phosphoheptulonate synthase [Clostridiales bacterium]
MFEKVREIMSAEEVRKVVPFPEELKAKKVAAEKEIANILTGKDKRKLFIIGPCSADNEDAVCDYCCRLARVAEKVKDRIYVLARVYTNKPRTRGEGYKGMFHSPDPHKNATDIQGGILALRKMHIRVVKESGLFAADEMLYPDNLHYIDDVLGYIAVGARSSENQMHRLVASGIDAPVGVKNPMNGSLAVLLNSIYAAQIPNEFMFGNTQVKTNGNPLAHALLRGAVDVYGNNIANYHFEDVMRLFDMYSKQGLKNPAVIIDTNHSN